MKKTKRLIAIIGVALILSVPVLGLVPPTSGRAYAAPSNDASPGDLVKSYIYLRAVARCIEKSELADGSAATIPGVPANQEIEPHNAEKWHWFSDGETYLGQFDEDDHNGIKSCSDNDWLQEAFTFWGWEDTTEAICHAGFKRQNTPDGSSIDDCIKGTGNFERNGSDQDARNLFITAVNEQYYGKAGTTALPTMTDAMLYYYYSRSFITLCDTTPRANPESYDAGDVYDPATGKGNDHLFRMLADDGVTYFVYETGDKNAGDEVTIRANDTDKGFGKVKRSCGELVGLANKYAKDYADETGTKPGDVGPAGGTADSGAIDAKCGGFQWQDLLTFGLSWIMCPLIEGAVSAANQMEDVITGMLCINESQIFSNNMTCDGDPGTSDSRQAFHDAWNVFRVLALGLLAIGGLIMIISQGLGFEIFDAYTVKKTLPRILVAAIAITLSWQLLEALVTFSNALGIGVRHLIYSPFQAAGINTIVMEGGSKSLAFLFGLAGLATLGVMGLLSFILTAFLAILIAFFLLVVRNILVILLVIVAPIALAMYIMPNTEKYFKTWWDWLFKTLLVFPIITALIATGHVFAAITSYRSDSTFSAIVAFIAYFAPYFLIPAAFRFAGGAMATIGGFANDRSRGAFDRLKKFRSNRGAYNMQRMKDGERFNNSALNSMTSRATTRNFGLGRRGQAAYSQKLNLAATRFAKSDEGQAGQFNDDMLRAQTYASEVQARRALTERWGRNADGSINDEGMARMESAIAATKANGGFGANRQLYAAKQLATTGTGYDSLEDATEVMARVSGGNEAAMDDMVGHLNSISKQTGRWDLVPGYANLKGLTTQVANGQATAADFHQRRVEASRGADPAALMRGKPAQVQALTQSLGAHAQAQQAIMDDVNSSDADRTTAREEFIKTMGQMDQLKQSKSWGSQDNQDAVNVMDTGAAEQWRRLNEIMGQNNPALGPNTPEAQNRALWEQARSPRQFDRNDPRNQTE